MQTLASRENGVVKHACKLRQSRAFREAEGCFFAEGLRLCLELAKALVPVRVLCTAEAFSAHPELFALGGEQYEISDPVAAKLAETNAPQGVFCVFPLPAPGFDAVASGARWLMLENVQDPANVGTMLRSAAAFGFDGCVLTTGCADAFGGKALRASMGAAGRLPLAQNVPLEEALAALHAAHIPVYAAALQRAVPLGTVRPEAGAGAAVLIGNEGNGLTDAAIEGATATVRIPMTDKVESLNAAAAAAVLLWHFRGESAE